MRTGRGTAELTRVFRCDCSVPCRFLSLAILRLVALTLSVSLL